MNLVLDVFCQKDTERNIKKFIFYYPKSSLASINKFLVNLQMRGVHAMAEIPMAQALQAVEIVHSWRLQGVKASR